MIPGASPGRRGLTMKNHHIIYVNSEELLNRMEREAERKGEPMQEQEQKSSVMQTSANSYTLPCALCRRVVPARRHIQLSVINGLTCCICRGRACNTCRAAGCVHVTAESGKAICDCFTTILVARLETLGIDNAEMIAEIVHDVDNALADERRVFVEVDS